MPARSPFELYSNQKGRDMSSAAFPADIASIPNAESREKLSLVAKYQRWVLFSLLASVGIVCIILAQAFGMIAIPESGTWFLLIANWCVSIFSVVAIILLARQFMSGVMTIVFAILMFVPFVSLIALLVVNQKATGFLQRNGIRVGLLGANPHDI
jgi:hypothetical protein